jgi:hypothetical protein
MVQRNKAQAAMEFLLTYGWAILVVLVVIGALAYFGILNPANLLPDTCLFQVGISCVDFAASEGYSFTPAGQSKATIYDTKGSTDPANTEPPLLSSLNFDLINNLGEDVYVTEVHVYGDNGLDCMEITLDQCDPSKEDFLMNLIAGYPKFENICFSLTSLCSLKVDIEGTEYGMCTVLGSTSLLTMMFNDYSPEKESLEAITPEKIMFWPNGARLKQNLGPFLTQDYLSLPCVNAPPKGKKMDATIEIKYRKAASDSLDHVVYGELHSTIN